MSEGKPVEAVPARVSWKGHAMGLTFMLALTVVLCEIVLSFYGDPAPSDGYATVHRRSAVPGLTYEPIPGASTRLTTEDYDTAVEINSYGMRGAEPSPPDREGIVRIAAVGDSFAFGMGVEAEEAWPARLQQRLTREDRPVETLNFGVCGYSIVDNLAVIEHKTQPWQPRVVVLSYFLNDADTLPLQPLYRAFQHPLSPYRLKLGYFALLLRRTLDYKLSGETSYNPMLYSDKLSYWPAVQRTLDRIAAVVRERNTELIVVIFPSTPGDWSSYELRPLHEKLAAALRQREIEFVDMLEPFSRYDPELIRISPGDKHPTVFGHQIVAETLAPFVEAAIDGQTLSMR